MRARRSWRNRPSKLRWKSRSSPIPPYFQSPIPEAPYPTGRLGNCSVRPSPIRVAADTALVCFKRFGRRPNKDTHSIWLATGRAGFALSYVGREPRAIVERHSARFSGHFRPASRANAGLCLSMMRANLRESGKLASLHHAGKECVQRHPSNDVVEFAAGCACRCRRMRYKDKATPSSSSIVCFVRAYPSGCGVFAERNHYKWRGVRKPGTRTVGRTAAGGLRTYRNQLPKRRCGFTVP